MSPSPRALVPAVLSLVSLLVSLGGCARAENASSPSSPSPAVPPTISPFDGKTLIGWQGDAKSWRVENGEIIGEIPAGTSLGRNQFLFWNTEVHDFDLTVEYRISGVPSANSGIQVRTIRLDDGEAKGYQADLDDGAVWLGRVYEENGRGMIAERGARVSISPDGKRYVDTLAPADSFRSIPKKEEWNTYHVHAAASHLETWINGVLFTTLDDHQRDAAKYGGKIAFQLHSGPGPAKIEFRNLRFQDLGVSEVPGALTPAAAAAPTAAAPAKPSVGIRPLGADGKPLNLDFETGTLDGWTATGDAFKDQPIKGDTVSPRKPGEASNHAGDWWIGGYEKVGDEGKGTLTSPTFVVDHAWASFLIGGGHDPKQVRLELVEADGGKVIHTATGQDHENMRRVAVNLEAERGKKIFIRLVDDSSGGWGHINFDDFVFHDQEPVIAAAAAAPHAGGSRQTESPVLWQLERNPGKPSVVANADAQKTVAGMMVTHGFQAELVAAEPQVRQPIAFAIDDRGRLWVAEAYSYPNKQPEGKGLDRIVILEDKDGDGVFETETVFCEGLNLVSGLEVGFGGVWVGAAPQLLFIPDRNHDDKPDGPPEVMLDGWGHQDTHETLNSFSWGPDGWLYGNQGVFTGSLIGKPGTPNEQRVPLHAGVWRYHPVRHEFEIFATGGSNQWGLDFNDVGHAFMTHCRSFFGGGGTSYVIRNGYYWNQTNSNYAPFISNAGPDFAPDLKNYLPAASRYDDGEGGAGKPGSGAVFGGHAHAGTMIYLGDNWPDIYRDHVFTNNLFGAQMNHQENVRQGSGYETLHAGYDVLFTPDPHYLAVDLQTGPDGAVYIIDWCDLQHCHTPDHEKWDRSNGRIYRLEWAQTYKPRKVDLGAMSDVELVGLQTHRNDWFGRTARRLLQERAATGTIAAPAIAALKQLAASPEARLAVRGLWSLHAIGALDATLLAAAAAHPDDVVRGWAVQLATERPAALGLPIDTLAQLAKSDPSASVRLALASALPELPADACWTVGSALAAHSEDAGDRFLPKLIWSGLAKVAGQDLPRALALAASTKLPALADSIRWLAASNAAGREALATQLAGGDEDILRGLKLLAFGLKNEATAAMPKAWPQVQERLAKSGDAQTKAIGDQLSALFGDQAVLARMRAALADTKTPLGERRAAFDILKRTGDPQATPVFAGLLDVDEFRSTVIPLLARSSDAATATALLQRFTGFNDADRSAALGTLTSKPVLAMPLLQAVQGGSFDKKLLTALQIRQLRNLGDAEINRLLDQSWGKVTETSATAKATIAKFKKAYSEAPLWAFSADAGKAIFMRTCTVCHTMNGVGAKLGPDLSGSWRNGVDYFLENIVDPNAVVGEDYQLNVITKNDGTVLLGMIEKETDTTLVVRTLVESTNVPKKDIVSRKKQAQSLMPPGLLEAMSEKEVIELLKFLTTKN